jgi:hypothetical protein
LISVTGKFAAEAFLAAGPTMANPAAPAAETFRKFRLLSKTFLLIKKSSF